MDVRCTWEVVLFSSGMADVGAYHTVDTWRFIRGFTIFSRYGKGRRGGPYRMGVNGAHNTIEENVSAYNIVCVRKVVEYYFCRCTGYGF